MTLPTPPRDATSEVRALLEVQLNEYRVVQNLILQLREQQNRLTNYGLIAAGAFLAAAGALSGQKSPLSLPLSDVYATLDFGALGIFMILFWQHIYVDRTMFRLDEYLIQQLKPVVKGALRSAPNAPDELVSRSMNYEEFFFRHGEHASRLVSPWPRLWDIGLGGTRYAVALFGVAGTLTVLAVPWPWASPLGKDIVRLTYLTIGAVAFATTIPVLVLLAKQLRDT